MDATGVAVRAPKRRRSLRKTQRNGQRQRSVQKGGRQRRESQRGEEVNRLFCRPTNDVRPHESRVRVGQLHGIIGVDTIARDVGRRQLRDAPRRQNADSRRNAVLRAGLSGVRLTVRLCVRVTGQRYVAGMAAGRRPIIAPDGFFADRAVPSRLHVAARPLGPVDHVVRRF